MLKTIKHIKDFGSFTDYKAPDDLESFKKYNLIWGLNGVGKTTFSRFFIILNFYRNK